MITETTVKEYKQEISLYNVYNYVLMLIWFKAGKFQTGKFSGNKKICKLRTGDRWMSATPAMKQTKPCIESRTPDFDFRGAGLNSGQDTDYVDCGFLWCPSVP
jgi:hypothetical protein